MFKLKAFSFLFFFVFHIALGHSFTFNNNAAAAFDKDEITVNVNDTDCAGADSGDSNYACNSDFITPQKLLDLTERAINRFWNRIPTTRLNLVRGSLVSKGNTFRRGQLCNESYASGTCTPNTALKVSSDILISCNCHKNNFGDSNVGILGVTIPNNYDGVAIKGSLILINGRHDGFHNLTDNEKINVIGHEIGHALGLGHSPVEDSLMYYSNIGKRDHLGWDDLDGISYLYPSSQPLNLNCGTVSLKSPNDSDSSESNSGPNNTSFFLLSFFSIVFLGFILRYGRRRFFRSCQKAL